SSTRRTATRDRCARSTRRHWTLPASRLRARRRRRRRADTTAYVRARRSAALEHACPLVVRHDLVEQALLGLAVVEVVRPHVLAEDLLRERALLPQLDRFAQRRWERLCLAGLVRVALQLRAGVRRLLDPVETGREQRRVAEVRVHVGSGDPALDPARLTVADDPEPARPVVATPAHGRGRPALGCVALVRVDARRDEERELPNVLAQSAEVVAEQLRLVVSVDERAFAALERNEAGVNVAGAADVLLGRLRHEGHGEPIAM